jgi:3-methyladenine DNA glycosylase AlkD
MADLTDIIRAKLRAVADPGRAAGMQAYMKSDMPYLGVSAVPLRAVCKAAFADLRYAAIELTGIRTARSFQTMDALPEYDEMRRTSLSKRLTGIMRVHSRVSSKADRRG